jgi:hypothetical protein
MGEKVFYFQSSNGNLQLTEIELENAIKWLNINKAVKNLDCIHPGLLKERCLGNRQYLRFMLKSIN